MNAVVVGTLGLGFLIAEGAMLSLQGHVRTAAPLAAVLVASAASSIAGFAFSALCGALLFHLMDNPVYAVQVMIICSIAIQLFSVATLRHSIEWRSLPVFLVGGILGVPAGAWLLLHLPSGVYRGVIGGLLIVYGCYQLLRLADAGNNPNRSASPMHAPVFSAGSPAGLRVFPAHSSRSGAV